MGRVRSSRLDFGSMPWGLLLIWWGILALVPARPKGVGALGVALILLGVNALRIVKGSAVSRLSVTVGLGALVLSALPLLRSVLPIPPYVATLPVVLIACGAIVLAWEFVD
jgi:hypothetical protein